jgi:hypothetical protein
VWFSVGFTRKPETDVLFVKSFFIQKNIKLAFPPDVLFVGSLLVREQNVVADTGGVQLDDSVQSDDADDVAT